MKYQDLLVFFVFLFLSQPSSAGILEKALSACTMYLEKPYLKLMEANENETLELNASEVDGENFRETPFTLSVGKRLGAGYLAQAVIVTNISDAEIEEKIRFFDSRYFTGTMVAKIPHALRKVNLGYALLLSNSANEKEFAAFENMKEKTAKVETNSLFPKNPAWKKGALPVAPILGTIKTKRGLILMKALVKGENLGDLAKRFAANGNVLPADLEEGLKSYYDFVQAVYAETGFSTDIRPTNFVWLKDDTDEERKQLAFLGYSRPGLLAYEMGRVPFNKPQYIEAKGGHSFEKYKAEVIDYLQRELRK